MTIGERIKNRRIELGLSVDNVAAELGKNRATIYRYEGDEIENLPTTVLEPLAKILQTTPAYLMGWDDDPYDYDSFDEYIPPEFNGDAKRYLQFLEARDKDVYNEHTPSPTEEKLRLLARHLDEIPKENRERILKNFEDTIDLYLSMVREKSSEGE